MNNQFCRAPVQLARTTPPASLLATGLTAGLVIIASPAGRAADAAKQSAWSTTASATVREAFDSNVFMQRVGPQANESSLVSTFVPALNAQWKPSPEFGLSLSYAPEVTFYHSASSEDFVAHRVAANLSGKAGKTSWEWLNGITWIDGNHQSPLFFGPGGAPALGGVPLRDRRDAFIYRGGIKLQHALGDDWLVRGVATAYWHDFQTAQQASPPGAVYANYVDRGDVNGGADFGYKVHTDTFVFIGYRYGAQQQSTALGGAIRYANTYQRVLAGIEGQPWSWLKVSLSGGPDFRNFGANVPATFQNGQTELFLDATATITPSKTDSFALTAKRFLQPGYGGASVNEDVTYEVAWKHKLGSKLVVGAGLRALNWDFKAPVVRNEWWYNANVSATYAFNKNLTGEVSYGYDCVESLVPATEGREAQRHIVSLSAKYTF